jgi:hypothetical protein
LAASRVRPVTSMVAGFEMFIGRDFGIFGSGALAARAGA